MFVYRFYTLLDVEGLMTVKKPVPKAPPRLTPRLKDYLAMQEEVDGILDQMDGIWMKMTESEHAYLDNPDA